MLNANIKYKYLYSIAIVIKRYSTHTHTCWYIIDIYKPLYIIDIIGLLSADWCFMISFHMFISYQWSVISLTFQEDRSLMLILPCLSWTVHTGATDIHEAHGLAWEVEAHRNG